MEKKKLTKYLWHGSDIDAEGNPIIPEAAPEGEHILGLNEGEIYIHNHPENPTLYTLSSDGKVVSVGGNTDVLDKRYLRKDKDDRSKGKISSDKGFEVGKFESGTLGTGASMYEGEDKNTYIEADFLKIRKKATFTTITVQELKHVGGEIILSPAAMICSKVEETELGYKCYFNTEDSDGRKIYNEFEVGDFARCQTFNLEHNKYYWRYVSGVGNDYIVLSKFDCDSNSDIPEAGDNISQLGNRYDEERQNAIVLSAYGEDAPSYNQYKGINGYALSEGMLVTKLSPKGNMLKGDFISQSTGKNIEQEFKELGVDIDIVKSQVDKEFTIWFYDYEPTLDNYPASEWNTEDLLTLHNQDIFYHRQEGFAYRFEYNGTSAEWVKIDDADTLRSLEIASGKMKVFLSQPSDNDVYKEGDLWVNAVFGDLYDNDTLVCITPKQKEEPFSIIHWQPASSAKAIIRQLGDRIELIVSETESGIKEAKELAQSAIDDINETLEKFGILNGKVNENSDAIEKNSTAILQTQEALAAVSNSIKFDNNGNITNINTAGLVTGNGTFADLFAQSVNADGNIVKRADLVAYVQKNENGELESGVVVAADNINFYGKTVINGKFIVDANGNITMNDFTANNGVFNGEINAEKGTITGNLTVGSGSVPLVIQPSNSDGYPSLVWNSSSQTYLSVGVYYSGGYAAGQIYAANNNGERSAIYPNDIHVIGASRRTYIQGGLLSFDGVTIQKDASGILQIYASKWPVEDNGKTNYMYVDGNGYVKVKNPTRG